MLTMLRRPSPLRAALWSCRRDLLTAAGFSFFINSLMLTLPLYVMQIFRRVLQSHSLDTLFALTLIALAAMAIYGVLSAYRNRLLVSMSAKLDTMLAERVHAALIARAARSNEPRTVEGLRDLAIVRNVLGGHELQMILDLPWASIFIVCIYLLHPLLGIVSLLAIIVLLGMAVINDVLSRPSINAANAASGKAFGTASTNVRNAEVIQGMGMLTAVIARWRKHNTAMLRSQAQATSAAGSVQAASRSARLMIQILVFAVGSWLVIDRALSPGAMMAAIFLMARALMPLESAIGTWKQFINARAAYRRLDALLQMAPEHGTAMRLPAPKGRLSVEQVSFVPPGVERPVLRGVSFSIEPGTLLGIIGPSAAGKSTLAKIITGVWEASAGIVRLDGADVAAWDPDDLGQYVGYMPQDVELFEGTVRDNIARMTDADADDIIAAARLAGAHDMILKLPKGYETEIGEGGCRLSGGQRQRIGLARALFGNPRLLILDEPNSNLDTEGEQALSRALAKCKARGVTTLVIAHRPSVLAQADRLLLLNEGRVEMYGPRAEVMTKLIPQQRGARPVVELVKSEEVPRLTDKSAS